MELPANTWVKALHSLYTLPSIHIVLIIRSNWLSSPAATRSRHDTELRYRVRRLVTCSIHRGKGARRTSLSPLDSSHVLTRDERPEKRGLNNIVYNKTTCLLSSQSRLREVHGSTYCNTSPITVVLYQGGAIHNHVVVVSSPSLMYLYIKYRKKVSFFFLALGFSLPGFPL